MNKPIVLFYLLFCSFLSQGQALEVSYQYQKSLPAEALAKLSALGPGGLMATKAPTVALLYLEGQRSDCFFLPMDTLIGNVPVRSGLNTSLHYFKDRAQRRLYRSDQKNTPHIGTDEPLQPLNTWQLRPDLPAKRILGYSCQAASMATGGGETLAWYAPQLPYPDGPLWYALLPGLILAVETPTASIEATRIKRLKALPAGHTLDYSPDEVVPLSEHKDMMLRASTY
ncbi:GLPGLI family protein [Phaeodactylibacter luteus]|nr:GLPGLI family protein [Phaeodactylibacter luteus]